jgi:hypothetical protein
MKTLYEGILSDIEDTIKDGDKYIDAVKELDVTKKLTTKDWEPVLDNDVVGYEIHCHKWLTLIGLPEFHVLYIEISFYDTDLSGAKTDGVEPDIAVAIYDKDFIKSRIINGVMPGLHKCKSRADAEKLVIKTIKTIINSKNSEKLRKIILSHL